MNLTSQSSNPFRIFSKIRVQPGTMFGIIILMALLAFEVFNYSTTDFALKDLLGEMKFAGVYWSTILSIAFCGIDFAGIARLFTPERGAEEPKEVWYLFGAWLLAATMNAILTWWGVSMAITNHAVRSSAVIDANTLTKIVPIFVAVMVWVIRILIIGTLSVAGERFIWGDRRPAVARSRSMPAPAPVPSPVMTPATLTPRPAMSRSNLGMRAAAAEERPTGIPPRPEPTYHSVNMAPRPMPGNSMSGENSSTTGSRKL